MVGLGQIPASARFHCLELFYFLCIKEYCIITLNRIHVLIEKTSAMFSLSRQFSVDDEDLDQSDHTELNQSC